MTYYDLKKYTTILSTDTVLSSILYEYGYIYSIKNSTYTEQEIENYNNTIFYNLAQFYFANSNYIQENLVSYLTDTSIIMNFDLVKQLYIILGTDVAPILVISHIYYTLKYSTIKFFFRDNYKRFMPDFDSSIFTDGGKLAIFQTALMQEFDKFSSIIEQIKSIGNIDTIPAQYLNYIAQLIGYENTGIQILSDEAYRYLIKNIMDIYNIKGTSFSFELFFNFLGFNTEITEYWFDRRLYFSGYSANPFTGEADITKFGYYLTAIDPRTNKYSFTSEITNKSDGIFPLKDFDTLTDTTSSKFYPVPDVLGYTGSFNPDSYTGEPFDYFKTNIVGYKIISIDSDYRSTSITSADMIKTIYTYIEMLTPINIYKIITFSSSPFIDDGSAIDPLTGIASIMPQEDTKGLARRGLLNVNEVGSGDINGNFYYVNRGSIFPGGQILPTNYVYDYISYPARKSNPADVSGSIYNSTEDNESKFFVYFATNPGVSGVENGTDNVYFGTTIDSSALDFNNDFSYSGIFMRLNFRDLGNLRILNTLNFYEKDSYIKSQIISLIVNSGGNTLIQISNPYNGDNIIKLKRNSLGQLSGNTIELRYLVNRAQDGIYDILTASFDNPSNPTYLNITMPMLSTGSNQGVGGFAYINRENTTLARIRLDPFYSDRPLTYLFTRKGFTWTSKTSISGFTQVASCAATDNNGTWVVAGQLGYYSVSRNNGVTWSSGSVMSGWSGININAITTDENGTWVAVGQNGYYSVSRDNGITWSSASVLNNWTAIAINSISTDKKGVWIIVGDQGYISISTDGAFAWSNPVSINSTAPIYSIATDYNGRWVIGRITGIYNYSNNNGSTWSSNATMTGWGSYTITSIATDFKNKWFAVSAQGNLNTSNDNGATWTTPTTLTGWSGQATQSIATDGNGTWAVVGGNNYYSVTYNNGTSWTSATTMTGWTGGSINYIKNNASVNNKWIAVGELGGYSFAQ